MLSLTKNAFNSFVLSCFFHSVSKVFMGFLLVVIIRFLGFFSFVFVLFFTNTSLFVVDALNINCIKIDRNR